MKITDLIIGQDYDSPNNCDACTGANPPADCEQSANFYAYDFQDSGSLPVPVTAASPSIWFKAGECGSSMDATGSMAEFQTKIFKPMTVDQATQIVSQKTILPTDIICEYPKEIVGIRLDSDANIQADGSTDEEK